MPPNDHFNLLDLLIVIIVDIIDYKSHGLTRLILTNGINYFNIKIYYYILNYVHYDTFICVVT